MTTATTHPRSLIGSHKTGATAVAGGVLGLVLGAGATVLLVSTTDSDPAVATTTDSTGGTGAGGTGAGGAGAGGVGGEPAQLPAERDPLDVWLKQHPR